MMAFDHVSNRRQFLATSAAVTAGLAVAPALATDSESAQQTAEEKPVKLVTTPVTLVESTDADLYRIRLAVKVQGNANLPVDPLASKKRERQLPIQSDAVFDYEERYRWPSGAAKTQTVMAAERYYHEAASEATINKKTFHNELRPGVRSTLVRRDTLPEFIYCDDDYFTHDELALLRTPVSAVRLGDLLPSGVVTNG